MTTLPARLVEFGFEQERAIDDDFVAGDETAKDFNLAVEVAAAADRLRFVLARAAWHEHGPRIADALNRGDRNRDDLPADFTDGNRHARRHAGAQHAIR